MESNLNILIIDQDAKRAKDLAKRAGLSSFGSCEFRTQDCSTDQLATLKPDMVILGKTLGTILCMELIHKLKVVDPAMPIMVASHHFHSDDIFRAPFEGVYYLDCGMDWDDIATSIGKALKSRSECDFWAELPVIAGQSDAIKEIKGRVHAVSDKDVTVLVTGETGTGKELIARSIHYHSRRNKNPLVKVNCTSLPDDLLESEVFGFQKGAFTDAHRDKPGRIELADNGTLFIDEIGDLSLPLQVKFLQVLEDKAFSRLGSVDDRVVDVRVVAATNSDLWGKVQEGTFRKDLFYRLNVVHLKVPTLRDRKDDIPLLIHFFMNKYCFELKKEIPEIPHNVFELFEAYHWPGNVRELENVVRRAIVLRDWDFVFHELRLKRYEDEGSSEEKGGVIENWTNDRLDSFLKDHGFYLKRVTRAYVSEMEQNAILKVLNDTQWNRTKAAELLQVSYKTLLNRIDEFGLKPPKAEGSRR